MRLSGAAGMVVEAPELIPLCFPGADVLGGLVGEESMRCQQAAQPVRLTPPLVPPTVVVSARPRRCGGADSWAAPAGWASAWMTASGGTYPHRPFGSVTPSVDTH